MIEIFIAYKMTKKNTNLFFIFKIAKLPNRETINEMWS